VAEGVGYTVGVDAGVLCRPNFLGRLGIRAKTKGFFEGGGGGGGPPKNKKKGGPEKNRRQGRWRAEWKFPGHLGWGG